MTTLLICDDHKVLTDALATVVGLDDGLQLVAPPVHDPETAIELSAEHLPDVVLMDIVFEGGTSGIEATRRIKEISPATKVVIITDATPEGRHVLRHSTAHVMAQAVTRLFPGAKFSIGPAICTVFATGDSVAACRDDLVTRAAAVYAALRTM